MLPHRTRCHRLGHSHQSRALRWTLKRVQTANAHHNRHRSHNPVRSPPRHHPRHPHRHCPRLPAPRRSHLRPPQFHPNCRTSPRQSEQHVLQQLRAQPLVQPLPPIHSLFHRTLRLLPLPPRLPTPHHLPWPRLLRSLHLIYFPRLQRLTRIADVQRLPPLSASRLTRLRQGRPIPAAPARDAVIRSSEPSALHRHLRRYQPQQLLTALLLPRAIAVIGTGGHPKSRKRQFRPPPPHR